MNAARRIPTDLWWALAAASLIVSVAAFAVIAPLQYGDDALGLHPTVWMSAIGVLAGICYLALPGAIGGPSPGRFALAGMIVIGVAARIALIPTDPLWEIDFYRYLWDGGVVWSGGDPYRWSPEAVLAGDAGDPMTALAASSGGLVGEINYPTLRTIYPPLAQSAFALAHALGPWNLISLKLIYLMADGLALAMMLTLLARLGLPPLWAALYWWNPLAVQLVYNAGHMDVLLVPFMLGALLATLSGRRNAAALLLAAATAVKLWPALLLPALLRYRPGHAGAALKAAAVFAAAALMLLAPQLLAGLETDSGLTAFTGTWQRNDAVFGLLLGSAASILDAFSLYEIDAGRVARVAVAGAIVAAVLWSNRRPAHAPEALIRRCLLVPVLFLVLGPTVYPWYAVWLLPLIALIPRDAMARALLIWTATLPLYHLRFHPWFLENPLWFEEGVVWIEHLPVLIALTLAAGLGRLRATGRAGKATAS